MFQSTLEKIANMLIAQLIIHNAPFFAEFDKLQIAQQPQLV